MKTVLLLSTVLHLKTKLNAASDDEDFSTFILKSCIVSVQSLWNFLFTNYPEDGLL
jgi:hypothetical protein